MWIIQFCTRQVNYQHLSILFRIHSYKIEREHHALMAAAVVGHCGVGTPHLFNHSPSLSSVSLHPLNIQQPEEKCAQ